MTLDSQTSELIEDVFSRTPYPTILGLGMDPFNFENSMKVEDNDMKVEDDDIKVEHIDNNKTKTPCRNCCALEGLGFDVFRENTIQFKGNFPKEYLLREPYIDHDDHRKEQLKTYYKIGRKLNLTYLTVEHAIILADIYMDNNYVPLTERRLLYAGALHLACKYDETYTDGIEKFTYISDEYCLEVSEVLSYENRILIFFSGALTFHGPLETLREISIAECGCSINEESVTRDPGELLNGGNRRLLVDQEAIIFASKIIMRTLHRRIYQQYSTYEFAVMCLFVGIRCANLQSATDQYWVEITDVLERNPDLEKVIASILIVLLVIGVTMVMFLRGCVEHYVSTSDPTTIDYAATVRKVAPYDDENPDEINSHLIDDQGVQKNTLLPYTYYPEGLQVGNLTQVPYDRTSQQPYASEMPAVNTNYTSTTVPNTHSSATPVETIGITPTMTSLIEKYTKEATSSSILDKKSITANGGAFVGPPAVLHVNGPVVPSLEGNYDNKINTTNASNSMPTTKPLQADRGAILVDRSKKDDQLFPRAPWIDSAIADRTFENQYEENKQSTYNDSNLFVYSNQQ
ncbi:hypothetical protein M427DRAFT_50223 [Gonapodya prolifera JEL478]|uniref:Cyclin N-terminal domain-containing protein n=1 Tax=Gonapodya prolifera (strain JEL478) TaxID=1344416 RepID=A0A138ZWM2_GONPJ|nr:hypothetical protein M427DRAFT_50223 [Gonapodya prolifera JEL478]|eukprot:KXS08897.1 hypothetical protein M427DRAFT_50223 [Gonapodya prolifera JEL478]